MCRMLFLPPLSFFHTVATMARLFFGKVAEKVSHTYNLHLFVIYCLIGKKMKRSALITALLVLSLSACGEKAAETTAPVAVAPATEVAAVPATEAAASAVPATEAAPAAAPATK